MKLTALILLGFLLLIAGGSWSVAWSEIYGYQDKNGYWHFPSVKSPETDGDHDEKGDFRKDVSFASYMPHIMAASRKYNVSPAFVMAIIMAESGYDRTAVSGKGAMGLMQLMPKTAAGLKVGNPFSPRNNIDGGVKYLKYLLDKFHDDIALAAAAYNAGPSRVEATGRIPAITETKQFVQKVLYFYYQFKWADSR